MPTGGHPNYPNSTIQELICEIFFRTQEGDANPFAFGQLFELVKAEFPVIETVPVPMFNLQIGPGSISPIASSAASQVLRYRHVSRPLLLQISDNRIVINAVASYPGWQQFKADIQYAWGKVVQVMRPQAVSRMGVRYINRIERSTSGETLGAWLVSTEYVPQAVLSSRPGFLSQVQVMLTSSERINVIVGEVEAVSNTNGAFIFDIDRVVEQESSTDSAFLLAETERLHEDVWKVFSSAKGERLERLLKGELS